MGYKVNQGDIKTREIDAMVYNDADSSFVFVDQGENEITDIASNAESSASAEVINVTSDEESLRPANIDVSSFIGRRQKRTPRQASNPDNLTRLAISVEGDSSADPDFTPRTSPRLKEKRSRREAASDQEPRQEFQWLIKNEVHKVFNQLREVLEAAARRYPVEIAEVDTQVRQEKYVMATSTQTSQDQLKCILTITGDSITSADMTLKLHKHPNVVYHTTISAESPWRLQQIQDSGNYLRMALSSLALIPDSLEYISAEEVLSDLDLVLGKINRARSTLAIPRKRTIDELMNSKNMKTLTPSLPSDLAVSFYLQAHKLIFAVYHLTQAGGTVKFETLQSESPVTWLNEVLVLLSVALHRAQQLRDKVYKFFSSKSYMVV
uniref:EOG090X0AKT n=1 Tax=Simocephalus serrulatus TaxID=117539 RepID=A0A4Y7NPJ8_9CRUS|nr:EOG090X0AKT [Simocephalus serrulatus]SVE94404.1 EOG090X0AKT [Simocephalus serrulatus]